jgi:hypothetical protein
MSQFKVQSQLMQNHRLAAPVTGVSQVAAARDGSGQLSLFSVGSSGHVYQTYPDPASDTGWSVRDLSYPSTAIALASYANPDGTITLVAADGKTGIHQILLPASPASPLPKWTTLPSLAAQGVAIGMAPSGGPAVCACGKDNNFYWLQIAKGAYTWGLGLRPPAGLTAVTAWAYAQVFDTDDWSGPSAGVVWTPQWMNDAPISLASRGWWGGSGWGCDAPGTFSAVATFMNAQGRWDVFAVNSGDQGVYYLQAPVGAASQQFTATKISGAIPAASVVAGHVASSAANGPSPLLEAFILDTSGHLCVTAQLAPPATGWGDCLVLNETLTFVRLCSALTMQGNSEVFAVTAAGTVYHVWQDPETTDWSFDLVEVAFNGQLEDVPTYQTIVSATDVNGQPLMFASATVAAPNNDSVLLQINGQAAMVAAGAPWTGTTDATGRLVISQMTSALASPVLQVTIAGVPGPIPPIDASGTVQGTLAAVTGQQLIEAGLLASQFQSEADQVAAALQQSMAMVPPAATPTAAIHPGSTMAVLSGNGGRARPAAQAWSYDVSSGRPRFQLLSSAEAAAAIAAAHALPPLVGGVLDTIEDAWGDVVSAVENGAAAVVTWTIDAASATLTLLVNGAQYYYDAAIDLVEDALDLAEQILTSVQVFFTNLFDWLGFVFNWQNILRTQQAVVYAVNQVLEFFQQAAGVVQQQVDANLQSFAQTQMPQLFQQAESFFGVNTSFGQYLSQNQQPLDGFDSPQATLMTTHLVQNVGSATSSSAGPSPAAVAALGSASSTLQGVLSKIDSLSTTYGTNQKIEDAQNFLSAAMTSQDQCLQLAMNGLFAAVEAALLAVVEGVQLVVDAVLSAVQTIIGALQTAFNTSWNIPIVSQLYARMTTSSSNPGGLTLTSMSLLGLLIAAPTTVVYSAVNGAAPFPDDASVASFQASFTAQTLLANSGLVAAAPAGVAQAAVSIGPRAAAAVGGVDPMVAIFAYAHASQLAITAVTEPFMDLQLPLGIKTSKLTTFLPPQLNPKAYEPLATALLMFEIAGVTFSIPWLTGPQPWSTTEQAAWGSYGWIASVVKMLADGAFYAVEKQLPRQTGDGGTFFEMIFGFIEVVPALGQVMHSGGAIPGAAGIVCAFGDILRVARLKMLVTDSFGVSLAVLAATDLAGNLAQAGLTIASAYETNDAAAVAAPAALRAGGAGV